MKIVARPLDGANLQEGYLRLRNLVYPEDKFAAYDIEQGFSFWRWLESHPLGNRMQRWFLVTEEGEVVGHLAATAQYYRINGQRVVAHTPADYQVLPQYGFQALLLMRKFFRSTQNCVAVDMLPSVIAVETRLGAEEAGHMQYVAKLLNYKSPRPPPLPTPVERLLGLNEQTTLTNVYVEEPGVEPL